MKTKLISCLVVFACIAVSAGISYAEPLGRHEMSSIHGKGCCSDVSILSSCMGGGGACNGCGLCTGDYTTSGGTTYKCDPGGPPKNCGSANTTCTFKVICKPGTVVSGMECSGNMCYSRTGYSCIPCTSDMTPIPAPTATCG